MQEISHTCFTLTSWFFFWSYKTERFRLTTHHYLKHLRSQNFLRYCGSGLSGSARRQVQALVKKIRNVSGIRQNTALTCKDLPCLLFVIVVLHQITGEAVGSRRQTSNQQQHPFVGTDSEMSESKVHRDRRLIFICLYLYHTVYRL